MVDSHAKTYLTMLCLRNFRLFREIEIVFNERLTVLVAPNGGGKTAVLDGITLALKYFVANMENWKEPQNSSGFDYWDARRVLSPDGSNDPLERPSYSAVACITGEDCIWMREMASLKRKSRTTWVNASCIKQKADELRGQLVDYKEGKSPHSPTLPILCCYGAGRLYGTQKLTDKKTRPDTSRISGYLDCFSPTSNYKTFANWFNRYWLEALSEDKLNKTPTHNAKGKIEAVRGVVDQLLKPTGWHSLEWDAVEEELTIAHSEHGRLPVSIQSDGVRNIIGLAGDIAHRMMRLNPHLGAEAVELTPGIVMIDEVDMHLYPSWQQLIIDALCGAFPSVQFIITTHSPQVISTIPDKHIRIIQDGKIFSAPSGTEGAESQRILEDVFSVERRPDTEHARKLDRYLKLVDQKKWDSLEAMQLRKELDIWSQGQEPSLFDADLQIENMKWEMEDENL